MAPPTPCSTRAAISAGSPGATAQSAEATVNTAIAVSSTRRAPNRSVSQPESGMSTARVTR